MTYDYYINVFFGNLIPSEEDFKREIIKAKNYILSRINICHIPDIAYDCACALAESYYKETLSDKNKGIQSESIGGWTVTYSSQNEFNSSQEKKLILEDYLLGTGLLYCGL